MERFERAKAYPGTYFQLLPLELRKLLALYRYSCILDIVVTYQGPSKGFLFIANDLINIIRVSNDFIDKVPELLIAIAEERIMSITTTDVILLYPGGDRGLSIIIGNNLINVPLCKKIID